MKIEGYCDPASDSVDNFRALSCTLGLEPPCIVDVAVICLAMQSNEQIPDERRSDGIFPMLKLHKLIANKGNAVRFNLQISACFLRN